ncbi:hypothetical protein [Adhaeribacter aquaticus]|uniref:hypothetical protein n=1 Tax=Adhaeribacter aquaticus TaxID=299567 RepID=UPI0004793665|nr:hypothetical protein [Adhaeribacter aquaticus]
MKRKLKAIFTILTTNNYLMVCKQGTHLYIDYTMAEKDVKTSTGFIYNLIDSQDKTLEAFKELYK